MKDRGRQSVQSETVARPKAPAHTAEAPRNRGGIDNQTIVHHVRGGGSVAGFPGAPVDNQRQQGRGALPHRETMERAFGRSLSHLRARTGAGDLAPMGVRALALKDRIAFRESSPPPSVVAHEVTHALQHERGGSASSPFAPRNSAAE